MFEGIVPDPTPNLSWGSMATAPIDPEARRERRRRARAHRRRVRLGGLACLLCGAAVVLVALSGVLGSGSSQRTGGSTTRLELVASRAGQHLPAPISGESLVKEGRDLLIVGGLDSAGNSASGVFKLDPGSGKLLPSSSLPQPLHDAAAASAAGEVLIFGGGTSASTDTVESLQPGSPGRIVGHLPDARSDLAAVSYAGLAYLIGGYNGSNLAGTVLSTADGTRFRTAARLRLPVRYPAVVARAHTAYVFGGEPAGGKATDAIQAVDLARGTTRIAGHLPSGLSHASAIVLGPRIYILGGAGPGGTSDRILWFHPASGRVTDAGRLPVRVADAAALTVGGSGYLVGGLDSHGDALSTVIVLHLRRTVIHGPPPVSSTSSGAAPFHGKLLIADRGNNRLLVVNASKKVLWRYPAPGRPPPKGGFYFPDDGFFIHRGRAIISNEEDNNTIVEISYPSGHVIWSYGHPRTAGSASGYLNQPDDAFLLKNGLVAVADAKNCRILFIGRRGRPNNQIGTTRSCVHNPPSGLAYPNGDTPLRNGNVLVSEVNGSFVDEITPNGKLVWSVHLPLAYPSDPQQLGPNRYLVADYHRPGGVYEFNRSGRMLWSYHPSGGPGMLDHPSLAERLPNGLISVNDDYRHRVVLIDPKTRRIVWQYGRTDHPGRAPDRLRIPDGFDLLEPDGSTPTHPFTG